MKKEIEEKKEIILKSISKRSDFVEIVCLVNRFCKIKDEIEDHTKNFKGEECLLVYTLYILKAIKKGTRFEALKIELSRFLKVLSVSILDKEEHYEFFREDIEQLITYMLDGDILLKTIHDLEFSGRTHTSLWRTNGIRRIGQLVECSKKELLNKGGIGPYAIKEIISTLSNRGLSLREE